MSALGEDHDTYQRQYQPPHQRPHPHHPQHAYGDGLAMIPADAAGFVYRMVGDTTQALVNPFVDVPKGDAEARLGEYLADPDRTNPAKFSHSDAEGKWVTAFPLYAYNTGAKRYEYTWMAGMSPHDYTLSVIDTTTGTATRYVGGLVDRTGQAISRGVVMPLNRIVVNTINAATPRRL